MASQFRPKNGNFAGRKNRPPTGREFLSLKLKNSLPAGQSSAKSVILHFSHLAQKCPGKHQSRQNREFVRILDFGGYF